LKLEVLPEMITVGLLVPTIYLALVPGNYVAEWYRMLTLGLSAPSQLIFFTGLLQVALYASTHLSAKVRAIHFPKISDVVFYIHIGMVAVIASMMLSAAFFHVLPFEYGMRAFYAFLFTEFLIFPLLGSLYLQDNVRHGKGGLTTILLLSVAIYLCMVFLTAMNLIEFEPRILGSQITPLEAAGAKLDILLVAIVVSATSPFFLQSSGLYAVEVTPPPELVSAVYVLALGFLLYTHNRKVSSDDGFNVARMAFIILLAAIFAFSIAVGMDLIAPYNVAGRAFGLVLVLIPLLAAYFWNEPKRA